MGFRLERVLLRCRELLRCLSFDEVEAGADLCSAETRHLPLADVVGAGNDLAQGRLEEHFGKPGALFSEADYFPHDLLL